MAKRVRQIIFVIVLIGSCVGLVWLLLYSAGYRIHPLSARLEATGAIRVIIPGVANPTVWLEPANSSQSSNQVNFTHLKPGDYTIRVEAPGYQATSVVVSVEPSLTTILDPLMVWSNSPLIRANGDVVVSTPEAINSLPIELQAIIADLETSHDVLDVKPQNNKDTAPILLHGRYHLASLDPRTGQVTTLLRISNPILAATWYQTTPYVLYTQDQFVHVLDTREATYLNDQVIAEADEPITALVVDDATGDIQIVTAHNHYNYAVWLK